MQIGWQQPQTKNRPYLWLHGSKRDSEGTYLIVHPQPPTFCGFHPSELPKRTPRPPYPLFSKMILDHVRR